MNGYITNFKVGQKWKVKAFKFMQEFNKSAIRKSITT